MDEIRPAWVWTDGHWTCVKPAASSASVPAPASAPTLAPAATSTAAPAAGLRCAGSLSPQVDGMGVDAGTIVHGKTTRKRAADNAAANHDQSESVTDLLARLSFGSKPQPSPLDVQVGPIQSLSMQSQRLQEPANLAAHQVPGEERPPRRTVRCHSASYRHLGPSALPSSTSVMPPMPPGGMVAAVAAGKARRTPSALMEHAAAEWITERTQPPPPSPMLRPSPSPQPSASSRPSATENAAQEAVRSRLYSHATTSGPPAIVTELMNIAVHEWLREAHE